MGLLEGLDYLQSSVFEPLSNSSLRDLTRKTLFLVALAAAKRVGEIQALSRFVSFPSSAVGVSYVPEFLAKTETVVRPLPRSSVIQSLGDFLIIFCCIRSALYMCMCLGLLALLIVLTGYLSPLVVLRDPCQRTLYPLVPYPHTYIALYHSHAKLPVTHTHTHKNKKLLTIPLRLLPR